MERIQKILSLDMSSKTGWSIGTISKNSAGDMSYDLESFGLLQKTEKPDKKYPSDYISWAVNTARPIINMIETHKPDVLVIEETAKGSKNNFSQKLLEFIHYIMAEYISLNNIEARYFMTGEWRVLVGAKMSSAESKRNQKRSKIKKATGAIRIKDENGKVLGKITKKHVNIRRANELFGLSLIKKDEDIADAILLGYAYFITLNKNKTLDSDTKA